jgi:hypothetical protein
MTPVVGGSRSADNSGVAQSCSGPDSGDLTFRPGRKPVYLASTREIIPGACDHDPPGCESGSLLGLRNLRRAPHVTGPPGTREAGWRIGVWRSMTAVSAACLACEYRASQASQSPRWDLDDSKIAAVSNPAKITKERRATEILDTCSSSYTQLLAPRRGEYDTGRHVSTLIS